MRGAPSWCGVLLDVDVEDAAGGLQFAVGVAVVGALAAVDGDPFPDFGAWADRDDAGVGEGRTALAVDDDPVALGFEWLMVCCALSPAVGAAMAGAASPRTAANPAVAAAVAMVRFFMILLFPMFRV